MEDILMNTDYSSELQEITELARPLAKWLYDHKDPHFSIVITEDHVDLVQAVAGSPMTIIKQSNEFWVRHGMTICVFYANKFTQFLRILYRYLK